MVSVCSGFLRAVVGDGFASTPPPIYVSIAHGVHDTVMADGGCKLMLKATVTDYNHNPVTQGAATVTFEKMLNASAVVVSSPYQDYNDGHWAASVTSTQGYHIRFRAHASYTYQGYSTPSTATSSEIELHFSAGQYTGTRTLTGTLTGSVNVTGTGSSGTVTLNGNSVDHTYTLTDDDAGPSIISEGHALKGSQDDFPTSAVVGGDDGTLQYQVTWSPVENDPPFAAPPGYFYCIQHYPSYHLTFSCAPFNTSPGRSHGEAGQAPYQIHDELIQTNLDGISNAITVNEDWSEGGAQPIGFTYTIHAHANIAAYPKSVDEEVSGKAEASDTEKMSIVEDHGSVAHPHIDDTVIAP